MSRNEVLAGKAVVEFGIRSRIAQGLAGVQNDLNAFGSKVAGIGATMMAGASGMLAAPLMAASRMEETMSKFGVVFGEAANDVEEWSKTTAKAVGVSEESMAGMLAGMQDLLVPMGVMPSKAVGMSKTLSQLAVDLGSFNNAATPDVFRDLMAAITGESEPMKKYGVIVNETAVKQELLNMKMDPSVTDDAAKAQARLNIIMRGTTAAQGDAIRTADSFANQMKALWSSIMDTSAALGKNLVNDIAVMIKTAVSGVYAVRNFAVANRDLVRAIGLVATASVGIGASLVATGVALKVAAASMGTFMMASKIAAVVAATAWSGIALAFSVLTIKSRITAAVIRAGWTVAASAIGVAWTALTGALSVAMQGLIAAATAAAIVAPWVAGAAAIAVAWFGLDVVLATLAAGAAGVWAVAAGTVATAWAATSAFLIPVAAAISGVYAASAAFIGTAWTALSGAFMASGFAGAASAAITATAWSAVGLLTAVIAAEQSVSAAMVSLAWSGAAFIASAAWSGFIAVLSAVTTPAALGIAASVLFSGAWTVAAGVASAAWAVAWSVITGPILPIVAAVAAVVTVLGGLVGAAAYAAIAGADFGKAWEGIKETFGELVSVVNTTFDAIKSALGSGDYATAVQALWLGIQAGFWIGAEATLDAFKWLWGEAWAATKRFFTSLLDFTWKVMKSIVKAIMNPFAAAREIGTAIGELVGGAMTFDISAKADGAKLALKSLRDQMALTQQQSEAGKEATEAPATASGSEKFNADKQARIDAINKGMESGQIDPADAFKQIESIQGETEAYHDKVKAIEMEILALEKGEDAAEQARLKNEGLTDTEIKAIKVLQDKKKALEDNKKALEDNKKAQEEAQEKTQGKRVDWIFSRADELGDKGASPSEIFKRVMDQINSDEKGGKLSKENADDARGRARDDMDTRIGDLKQQGKALADSLRSPFEVMQDEIKGFQNLRKAGAIDDDTLQKATAKVRDDFAANSGRANGVDNAIASEKAMGPTGTFSVNAAGIIGMGAKGKDPQLEKVIKNGERTNKLLGKDRVARFGK